MQYQVVARSGPTSAGNWDYFPYLAPCRDKATAERLARYAAHSGYEAAILQSVTIEMLMHIARAVVEQQDELMLPKLRYMPGAAVGWAVAQRERKVESGFHVQSTSNPPVEGSDKAVLDARRSSIENGPGGDVADAQPDLLSFPLRMDVLRAWLRLRERMIAGQIGGDADGKDNADIGDIDW